MKKKKIALLQSVVAVVLSAAIFVGSTFAYFTDSVSSNPNIIQGGNLDIGLEWTTDLGINAWYDTEDVTAPPIFTYNNWEPGYTEVRYFKIENRGKLAFKYALNLVPNGQVSELADVIDVYLVENPTANITGREALAGMTPVCTLREAINGTASAMGVLLPKGADTESGKYYAGDIVVGVALKMRESAGNQYQNMSIGNTFSVQLVATQYNWEEDAFGPDYDEAAFFPEVYLPVNLIIDITGKVENGLLTEDITVEGRDGIRVTVKEGTKVEEGAAQLTPSISTKGDSDSNVKLEDTEEMKAYDVHVGGIHKDNTVPVIVDMGKAMPTGLNIGNYKLYHVENGTDKPMTSDANLDTHNDFVYDPATGNLTVAMATFSEVAVVADTEKAWEGNIATGFAGGTGTEAEPYIIANADQLAAFGAIVGGMAKDEEGNAIPQDSFIGKTVKLVADINLGDKESENTNLIFHPIGYYYTDDENA
ncbi:MAG: hypothetical protein J6C76_00815, partial [Oscillospiraceae bacterium]|nr:hypothetical protein [Oscillospiraceae bacterium]